MSQEDVEIVQRGWTVFSQGVEDGNLVALFDAGVYAPDAVTIASQEAFGSRTYLGREGFREWIETWTEEFLDWKIWPEEVIDVDDGRVLSIVRQSGTGKVSGAAVEAQIGIIHTVVNGRVVEQRNVLDVPEAYAAVGLTPPK